jgi:hypothetical protein
MTVDEFLAWVPPDQWGCWELIDGKPRWRMRPLRETDVVATTPEELVQLLDAWEGPLPGPRSRYAAFPPRPLSPSRARLIS